MREIKFRAWDLERKKRLYSKPFCSCYFGKLTAVGMCTDLKDSNGSDIYEGDIVKVSDDYNKFGTMAGEKREVYFSYGGFRLKPERNLNIHFGHWLEDGDDLEVIGNIYENPELLTKIESRE